MNEPIPYAPIERERRDFHLENTGEIVRLTFPATPRWHSVGGLVTTLACAVAITAGVVWINVRQAMLFAQFGFPPFPFPKFVLGSAVAMLIWWALAAWGVWDYRRWVGAVTTLSASPMGLLWERRSPRSYRCREIDRARITGVRVQPLRDIFGRKNVFDLYVLLRERRPMRWRIASRDAEFATRLLSELTRAVGLANTCEIRQNRGACPD